MFFWCRQKVPKKCAQFRRLKREKVNGLVVFHDLSLFAISKPENNEMSGRVKQLSVLFFTKVQNLYFISNSFSIQKQC